MKNKLISFSVALLAAVCLWVYVVTVVNQVGTDTLMNVPVTYSGEDQIREDLGLVVTEGADATVNLKVTCRRTTLTKLTSGGAPNVSVVVDVSRLKKAGEYDLGYSTVFPNGVSNSEVTTTGTPKSIHFTVDHFLTREIPVKGVLDGSVAEGYYESPMECTPRELTIEGPESEVARVSYAQVVMERTDLTETISLSCPYTLVDENGDAIESEYITVTDGGTPVSTIEARQPVLTLKELPLVLEFTDGGGATAEGVISRVEPKTIMVAGDAEVLNGVNRVVLGRYDLAQVIEPFNETLPVVLPDDLVNISGLQTAQVHVEIDEEMFATKNIRVTDFWPINQPEGYRVDVLSLQLMVRVRGPKNVVSRITGENLRAIVDAANLNEGTQSVPVSIEISGAAGVAALGEYNASVSLIREEE